jgi:plasmid segregation protein ParM
MTCVGIDVGHSAVKVAWRSKDGSIQKRMFPSVAIPAMTISDSKASERAAKEMVPVNGNQYFIGETAIHESGSIKVAGLHDRWLDMPEFQALVQGAVNIVMDDTGKIDSIATGLPPSIFREENLKMRNIVSTCTDAEVRVYQEPSGVSSRYIMDENGVMREDVTKNLGVVAIGRYTTDSMAMLDGRWVEDAAGSSRGMSGAANMVLKKLREDGFKVDYLDADDALWKGTIHYNGKQIDTSPYNKIALQALSSEIFDAVSSKFGDSGRKLERILVAGGGAELMFDGLGKYWPQAELVEDARYAVAEGFRRICEGFWNIRNVRN